MKHSYRSALIEVSSGGAHSRNCEDSLGVEIMYASKGEKLASLNYLGVYSGSSDGQRQWFAVFERVEDSR